MRIRVAAESDASGIAEVMASIAELKSVAWSSFDEIRARVRRALRSVAASDTSTVLVGVAEDGAIAGYCAVHWTPFLFLQGEEGYISELFIRPDNRSSGLGTTLLQEVEAMARERGCTRLSLLNGKGSQAYERGFYAKRNWEERKHMANFVLQVTKPSETSGG